MSSRAAPWHGLRSARQAVVYAARLTERKLELMRPLSLAGLFASTTGSVAACGCRDGAPASEGRDRQIRLMEALAATTVTPDNHDGHDGGYATGAVSTSLRPRV